MRNRSAPAAHVVPILIYGDVAKAVDWLCAAFGFQERLRAPDSNGVINHAQLNVGDGAIMVGRSRGPIKPLEARDVRQYVLVDVQDADAHCERAKQYGATILQAPADMPFITWLKCRAPCAIYRPCEGGGFNPFRGPLLSCSLHRTRRAASLL